MAGKDIEVIRAFNRAWDRGGVEAIEPFLAEEIEWIDPPELPGGGTHQGREATMAFLREWEGSMSVVRLNFTIDEISSCPDGSYFTVTTAQGAGEGGVPIPPHQWFHWIHLEGGKLVRARVFLDRDAALAAAGLA